MSQRRKKSGAARRPTKPKAKPLDLWRPVPSLPAPDAITPSPEPATLIRSLGDPPLQGQGQVAEHYLAAVVEAASKTATALAASVGLFDFERADED